MFNEVLIKRKSVIVENWIQLIFATYSSETSKFLNLEKDQFSNPVGFITNEAVKRLLDELVADNVLPCSVKPLLIDLIKIRAVQDFTPSRAVGFIILLKEVVRKLTKNDVRENNYYDDLLEFESRVDKTALIAFDLYQECREKLYRIHLNEVKTNSLSILK